MTTNKNRNMNTHFIKNLALVVAGLLMTISCSGNTGTKEKKGVTCKNVWLKHRFS